MTGFECVACPVTLWHAITTLHARGVAFRSLTEQRETTTPQGACLLSVFGALAQYERALAQERIKARTARFA
jgi:DNA invertase Pin-like site-specific DNA recombinase